MSIESDAKYWVNRAEYLKTNRSNWENRWQRVAELMYPSKADITVKRSIGQEKIDPTELVRSNAIRAKDILAASLHGSLTGPSVRWFVLDGNNTKEDKEYFGKKEVKQAIADSEQVLYNEFEDSNFYPETHTLFKSLVTFGVASLYKEDLFNPQTRRNNLAFKARSVDEMLIQQNAFNVVDINIRPFQMTIKNIMARWEKAKTIEDFVNKAEKEPDELIDLLHVVAPREDSPVFNTDFQYISLYILKDKKIILNEEGGLYEGYFENPIETLRWDVPTGEVYSDSPGTNAIYDVLSLNFAWKRLMESFDLSVHPPLAVRKGALDSEMSFLPAGITEFDDPQTDFREIITNINLAFGTEMVKELITSINQTFFVDQLEFPPMSEQGTPVTATEIQARFELMNRILGPTFGRFNPDFTKPLIGNTFRILARRNPSPLPDFPGVGRGNDLLQLNVEYVGPLRTAQNLPQHNNSKQLLIEKAEYENVSGQKIYSIDAEAYFRKAHKQVNAYPEMLIKESVVKKAQEAEAAARKQAIEMELLQQGAGAAKDGTQAINQAQSV